MDRRSVIVGHSILMPLKEIALFIASALHETNSDILLFVEGEVPIPQELLRTGRIILRDSNWRKLSESQTWHGLVEARFLEYYELLLRILHSKIYDNVLLSDTRDVLFQSDPFDKLENARIYFALEEEGVTLGSSNDLFGLARHLSPGECELLAQKPLVCCGTIIGDSHSIAVYLHKYEQIHKLFKAHRSGAENYCYDQGIANLVAHNAAISHGLNIELVSCGSLIATIGLTTSLSSQKIIVNHDKICYEREEPSIVHQYDRLERDSLEQLKQNIWKVNPYASLLKRSHD